MQATMIIKVPTAVLVKKATANRAAFDEGFKQHCDRCKVDESLLKRAAEKLIYKEAGIPMLPLLTVLGMSPLMYRGATQGVDAVSDIARGDSTGAGRSAALAGLTALTTLPFIGSYGKGLAGIGRLPYLQVLPSKIWPAALSRLSAWAAVRWKNLKVRESPRHWCP